MTGCCINFSEDCSQCCCLSLGTIAGVVGYVFAADTSGYGWWALSLFGNHQATSLCMSALNLYAKSVVTFVLGFGFLCH